MKDALGHGSGQRGGAFGKRATIPMLPLPAHQSRLGQLVKSFAASESGEGKIPEVLKDHSHDPDTQADALATFGEAIHEGKLGMHDLLHFVHFLGFLGACAVIDLVVLGLQKGI